jgi:hypothetical protein
MSYYKVSNSVLLQTRDVQGAKEHFQGQGMTVISEQEEQIEMFDGDVKLTILEGEDLGPIMELLVPDLEMAREDLESQGWTVMIWEGRGKRCYMSNHMGTMFSLVEDPGAYEEE